MDNQIQMVVDVISEWTGIVIREYHYPMLEYELTKLAEGGGVRRGAGLVLRGDPAARRKLISAISNSETYLFRHWGHFEALKRCAERHLAAERPFFVLSAGCSSGEECWSSAAVVGSVYLSAGRENFSVTGWDLDPERLSRARAGVYGKWATRKGFRGYESFFEKSADRWRVSDKLRPYVSFTPVNLIEGTWPCTERFDAILFRNVSIYWDRKRVEIVRDRLVDYLAKDGILLLGPSDPVELDSRQWSVETGGGAPVLRRIPDAPSGPPKHQQNKKRARVLVKNASYRRKPVREIKLPRSGAESRPVAPLKKVIRPGMSDIEDLANRGQYDAALKALLSLGLVLPPAQKLWEGILLLNLDRVQEAIKVFRHCVFLEPEEPSYRRWLAVALDSAGNKSEAAREYRNAKNIEVEV